MAIRGHFFYTRILSAGGGIMSYETGTTNERSRRTDQTNQFTTAPEAYKSPTGDFIGAGEGEITAPGGAPENHSTERDYIDTGTDTGAAPSEPHRTLRIAGYTAAAAVGLVTTAVVGGLINRGQSTDKQPLPAASASATPNPHTSTSHSSNSDTTGKHLTHTPPHSAPAKPDTVSTRDTSGTSDYELYGPGSKSVNRMQSAAHGLQHRTEIFGVAVGDGGCLEGTPYEHGVIKVEGIYEPGDSVVRIHPENATEHPEEPDLVFGPTPNTGNSSQISPFDDFTEQYAQTHHCDVTYGQVGKSYHGY
jgi:hypothetical protein